jgi:mono/diheme cytochrome c family protein
MLYDNQQRRRFMGRILFGFIVGILILPAAVVVWFYNGNPPIAVADPPFPQERAITHLPLNARIQREMPPRPPIDPTESTFVAGAHVYVEKCAVCHGLHGKPSHIGQNMYPGAPQLWEKHHNSNVVGVSDDPVGETFWKVDNGIRLTGMPDFKTQLTNNEIWQVSILLANADKPLPPAVLSLLRGEAASAVSSKTSQPAASTTTPAE